MKAEFKKLRTADGLPLTFGKMYEVLSLKIGRQGQLKKIKIKNDLGQECWYNVNKFKLYAEAAEYVKEQAAAGAGQPAAQSATPDGSKIFAGIDMANGADMTAGLTAREITEIGKEVARGFANGFGLHYGA